MGSGRVLEGHRSSHTLRTPALFHFLRAKPSFIFVRPSTVCNCYTCTRPNAAMAHRFHKSHSFSLFNIEKFCVVSWATMGGQAMGRALSW